MAPPTTTTASEVSNPPDNDASVLPKRALWGVVGLVVLTVGSLALAWLLPNATLFHFLWLAQAVPMLYLILVWWGIQAPQPHDDAS
jgi:hypothetical protein